MIDLVKTGSAQQVKKVGKITTSYNYINDQKLFLFKWIITLIQWFYFGQEVLMLIFLLRTWNKNTSYYKQNNHKLNRVPWTSNHLWTPLPLLFGALLKSSDPRNNSFAFALQIKHYYYFVGGWKNENFVRFLLLSHKVSHPIPWEFSLIVTICLKFDLVITSRR